MFATNCKRKSIHNEPFQGVNKHNTRANFSSMFWDLSSSGIGSGKLFFVLRYSQLTAPWLYRWLQLPGGFHHVYCHFPPGSTPRVHSVPLPVRSRVGCPALLCSCSLPGSTKNTQHMQVRSGTGPRGIPKSIKIISSQQ